MIPPDTTKIILISASLVVLSFIVAWKYPLDFNKKDDKKEI